MGTASSNPRRQNLTAKSLTLWLLQAFKPLFFYVSWALGVEDFKQINIYVHAYIHVTTINQEEIMYLKE